MENLFTTMKEYWPIALVATQVASAYFTRGIKLLIAQQRAEMFEKFVTKNDCHNCTAKEG